MIRKNNRNTVFTHKGLVAAIAALLAFTACQTAGTDQDISQAAGSTEPVLTAEQMPPIPEGHLRVHYVRNDEVYDTMVLWLWNDTTWEGVSWPEGLEKIGVGPYGAFYDVPLAENPATLGMVVVDKLLGDPGKDGGDKTFQLLNRYNEVWLRQGDDEVYVSSNFEKPIGITGARVLADNVVSVIFVTTQGLDEAAVLDQLSVTTQGGDPLEITQLEFLRDRRTVLATVEGAGDSAPLNVGFEDRVLLANKGWEFIDFTYGYDGELGVFLNEDNSATLKMWSPTVANVQVVLYDKDDAEFVVRDDIQMTLGDRGVWSVTLNESNTGIADLRGYFYHYKVDANGDGRARLALDPYAPSLAAYNSTRTNELAKAAIVDIGDIGPELDFADIAGFEKRDDAIIWEAHVRDVTSDPSIENMLTSRFGTYTAVIDKLDYVQSLGVTHIQLLPVMSFRFGDESRNAERELEYNAKDANFNWGYDPMSYFALSGMYSQDPSDPEARIEEFKTLVQAIHDRGMGVILDVVYNHTGDMRVLEDLMPGYYHFSDADGTPRSSYGGGRVATTRRMGRKLILDSIRHWLEEYKVDGFRFDLMGDMDAETVQQIWDMSVEINPDVVMVGEGWRTYVGDAGDPRQAADQDWMQFTSSVGVFSDEFRNELKSGFGSEGQPRFITGGPRSIQQIFENVKAQPRNFVADEPADVVTYIAAHDNLTLHDVIAQSSRLDPDVPEMSEEIHRRIRLGNGLLLTSQGIAFLHAGQEYGRTKQWRAPGRPQDKGTSMTLADGTPFTYPHFVHDSYDSSDAINMIEWQKVLDSDAYPLHSSTVSYTAGLIALRRSSDAFRLGSRDIINQNVLLVDVPEQRGTDLIMAWTAEGTDGQRFLMLFNGDTVERRFSLDIELDEAELLVDREQAGTTAISNPAGVEETRNGVALAPLTFAVYKLN